MTTKLKILLGIIAVQLVVLFLVLRSGGTNRASASAQASAFALTADSAQVDKVVFGPNTLQRRGGEWTINGNYPADPRLVRQLLDLLRKIEVKRPVAASQQDSLGQQLGKSGLKVEIFADGKIQNTYLVLGQGPDTYAQAPGEGAVQLFMPGYSLVLHEVFAMPEGEWRHKTIISTGFTSLRTLRVRYPASPPDDFFLERDSGFFRVQGIRDLDSAMVFNYVNAYRSVNVLAYLPQPHLLDSLLKISPFAEIDLRAINERNDQLLKIYVNPEAMFGILEKTNELVALDPRYFTRFLVRQKDFGK
jgi:hypothetical protein